ncbi:LysM peptidoglycan-binding domain-containing protein [Persicirhabdus sediminis]|uniref:LysM peptidoglycan-binding domain-containing protein n=2 Tax=Persicirhabdus sediminis TaxID=454144 RepID=A0A8J7MCB1_9BACT|nr:LysM peptidoglycan-binding domain-containing protein [Persicirhabdus sediminis]
MSVLLHSCGGGSNGVVENRSTPSFNPSVGPFDSRGNYVESWADGPPRSRSGSAPQVAMGSAPVKSTRVTPEIRETSTARKSTPAPVAQAPRKTTPRPVAAAPAPVKVKPKVKQPTRYTVKKGDTLYGLSRKYNTSVSAIQRTNGLKGSTIRIGQSLIIPSY